MGVALTYKAGCIEMAGYFDASWGNNPDNSKSTFGYWFMLAGKLLSLKTALQNVMTQSTLEAELIPLAHASKKPVYLSIMMAELGFGKLLKVDRSLATTPERRKHHLQLSHGTHCSVLLLLEGATLKTSKIVIHHVAIQKQLADVGTNPLTKMRYRHLLNLIETYTTIYEI